MNRYRVEVGADTNGKAIYVEIKAGDMQVEGGCLIFRKTIATNQIIASYKVWHNVMRIATEVQE